MPRDAFAVNQIESCAGDGVSVTGKTDQWEHRPPVPQFGVFRAREFQAGERTDHVADPAGTDEKERQDYYKP